MPDRPLVSVILPSYNHRRFVAESIDSVLRQTYPNIQLIVIDDGSTDGSVELISQLAASHGFHFESQRNRGLVNTLNRAKGLIEGKYVSLSASDDFYHPQKIERLVDYLEAHPEFAMVHSKIIQVDDESREIVRIDGNCKSGWIFRPLLLGEFHVNGLSALVRADVYSQFHYGQFYIDDLFMWLSIAERYPIGFVDEYLAYYRRHDNHLTGNADRMMAGEKQILDHFAHAPDYSEAVMRWRVKWFRYHAAQRDPALRATAIRLGVDLLRDRRLTASVAKGWGRFAISAIRNALLARSS
jgi:alpha-1,3-rhamnosyltransferase